MGIHLYEIKTYSIINLKIINSMDSSWESIYTFGFTVAIDKNIILFLVRTKQEIHKVCTKTTWRDKSIRDPSYFNFSPNSSFLIEESLEWRKRVYSVFFHTKIWWKESLHRIFIKNITNFFRQVKILLRN